MNNEVKPRRLSLRALREDRRGIVAVFVALSVPVLIGSVAYAIDFTNYRLVASRLQAAADAGALAGVKSLDKPATSVTEAVRFAGLNVPSDYGNVTVASDVTVGNYSVAKGFVAGVNADSNAVRVSAVRTPERGNAPKRILSVFWGPDEISLATQATAARQLNVQYEPPERMLLDNEAWDFNEVYAYCYDNSSKTRVAGTETLIGNNLKLPTTYNGANVTYKGKTIKKGATIKDASDIITISKGKISQVASDPVKWPECTKAGQSLSFHLRNYQGFNGYDGKLKAEEWDNYNTSSTKKHYTDTMITAGVESFPGLGANNILETVRCDTLDKCDPSKSGSTVPKGKNRNPNRETQPCVPGKFMYFGWEDRTSGSDKDFDDITMVMKCPKAGILGDGKTRLVG
jgi:Flp pilus assembly protein TadG